MRTGGAVTVLWALILSVQSVRALPVSEADAALAAGAFAARAGSFAAVGPSVRSVGSRALNAERSVFVVNFAGGGAAVMSDDTEREPVIVFSAGGLTESDFATNSPLAALLSRDAAVRATSDAAAERWQELWEAGVRRQAFRLLSGSLSGDPADVRVPKLLKTQWGQSTDGAGNQCFNLYTPSNSVCGCVATAMAQVMRYHGYPASAYTPQTHSDCWYVYGTTSERLSLTTSGGPFKWSQMPDTVSGSVSLAGRQALGRLASDVGIACEMMYFQTQSSSYSALAAKAFKDDFGYSSACYLASDYDNYYVGIEGSTIYGKTILSNLDAGLPVMLGISACDRWGEHYNGHSIVADGYGYDSSQLYVHLNMGWEGSSDLWYSIPKIGTGYSFSMIDDLVYNIMPTSTGAVLSGRVLDHEGNARSGVSVKVFPAGGTTVLTNLVTSNAGVFAAVLEAGAYDLRALTTDLCESGRLDAVTLAAPTMVRGEVEFSDPIDSTFFRTMDWVRDEASAGNSWSNDMTLEGKYFHLRVFVDLCGTRVSDCFSKEWYSQFCESLEWFPAGTEISYQAPDDAWWGEDYALSCCYRRPEDPNHREPGTLNLRLAGVSLSDYGEPDELMFDPARHYSMPKKLSFVLDRHRDVCWYYAPTNYQYSSGLPYWWYLRHLAGPVTNSVITAAATADNADPDGDGFSNVAEYGDSTEPMNDASFRFKIDEFSADGLKFTGSTKGQLVLERCARLGSEWRGVWTNSLARTSTTNTVRLSQFTTNGFYRVIYNPQ